METHYIISFIASVLVMVFIEIDRVYIQKANSKEYKVLKNMCKHFSFAFIACLTSFHVFRYISTLLPGNKVPVIFTSEPEF